MIVFSSLLRKKQSFGSSNLKSVVYVFVKTPVQNNNLKSVFYVFVRKN